MKPNHTIIRGLAHAAAIGAAVAAAGGLAGCRGERSNKPPRQFIPDMDDSPKFRNQAQAAFFPDRRSMRPRVAGAVAFGEDMNPQSLSRVEYLREDPSVFEGIDASQPPAENGTPAYHAVIPAAAIDLWIAEANEHSGGEPRFDARDEASRSQAVAAMVRRGQERFNIYCSACHGYEGDGQGLVGVRWGYPVPSFHDPKYADRAQMTGQDGYLFSVIRHGVPDVDPSKPPKMPSYADKVSVTDSWAIVAYMRALQASRGEARSAGAQPAGPEGQPMVQEVRK